MKRIIFIAALVFASSAWAQSVPPPFTVAGAVPTIPQWEAAWASKADVGTTGGGGGGVVQQGALDATAQPWQIVPGAGAAFNLGNLNGAATATNQATANASLSQIATNTGGPIPGGSNQIGYLNGPPVGSASIATGQVSCGTSSTALVAARTGAPGTGRVNITITNLGTTAVTIGNTGVTTSTGETIPGIAGTSLTLSTTAAIYCVASSAQSVSYVENF